MTPDEKAKVREAAAARIDREADALERLQAGSSAMVTRSAACWVRALRERAG